MGRAYQFDLDGLITTAEWADGVDVNALAESIGQNSQYSLLAIGSGGSKSVACLSALLHRQYTGSPAMDLTPLLAADLSLHGRSVQLFTASGSNPDVIGCFSQVSAREPESMTVISSASASPLALRSKEFWYTDFFGFDGPVRGEGFVATNSILAQSIIMMRAYQLTCGITPRPISDKLKCEDFAAKLHSTESIAQQIGPKHHVLVLFGEYGQPAATDLESKFSEVGLASVQLADFRNFAHGRHNWIAKHPDETVIISIEVGQDSVLASRTLRLLPEGIPLVRISIDESETLGSLLAMYAVIRLTRVYGQMHRIDPGKPGVPPYGSRLYRLNAWNARAGGISLPEVAIARKAQVPLSILRRSGQFALWTAYFWSFIEALASVEYTGLALDYDGTLCDRRDRFTGVRAPVREALHSVLRQGTSITVITGRGRSVGDALRAAIAKELWSSVRVAYYNGSEVHPLSFEGLLEDSLIQNPALQAIKSRIEEHPSLKGLKMEVRRNQLSIATSVLMPAATMQRILSDVLSTGSNDGIRVVTSAHSVDVILPAASKLAPLADSDRSQSLLCIGDRGEWPGNDFELLSLPTSLSCHKTSWLPDRCWHISPAGWRNSQTTLHYLASLQHSSSGFRIDRKRLLSNAS